MVNHFPVGQSLSLSNLSLSNCGETNSGKQEIKNVFINYVTAWQQRSNALMINYVYYFRKLAPCKKILIRKDLRSVTSSVCRHNLQVPSATYSCQFHSSWKKHQPLFQQHPLPWKGKSVKYITQHFTNFTHIQ